MLWTKQSCVYWGKIERLCKSDFSCKMLQLLEKQAIARKTKASFICCLSVSTLPRLSLALDKAQDFGGKQG
jgi:hypothetical protein